MPVLTDDIPLPKGCSVRTTLLDDGPETPTHIRAQSICDCGWYSGWEWDEVHAKLRLMYHRANMTSVHHPMREDR